MPSISGPGFQLFTHDSYRGLQLQGACGCVRASGLGWGNAYLKSGWERSVSCSVEKFPISAVWAACTLLQPAVLRHPQMYRGLKSDVYRPFRDHAAYPVSELFIQGLRRHSQVYKLCSLMWFKARQCVSGARGCDLL